MDTILEEIKPLFHAALVKNKVHPNSYPYYHRWLRFYFDFCLKYYYEKSNKESLPLFIKKLEEKKQAEMQRKQAAHAVSIYYGLQESHSDKSPVVKNKNEIISTKKVEQTTTTSDWRPVYNKLNEEIKLRHYSQKTLKS
jgi:hypothetical protein